MNIFFTSDHHFGHENIIKFANRPFNDLWEMTTMMIECWNSVVTPHDMVYHLGDFTLLPRKSEYRQTRFLELAAILPQLNGHIRFIEGNHDDFDSWPDHLRVYFEVWNKYSLQPKKFAGIPMLLTHRRLSLDPAETQHGTINLHGHHHSHYPTPPPNIDVGVDAWNFTPVALEDLKKYLDDYNWANWRTP